MMGFNPPCSLTLILSIISEAIGNISLNISIKDAEWYSCFVSTFEKIFHLIMSTQHIYYKS